ncbi:hypothetical protein HY449_00600 [Candidatus Pacearchaeota archaeon]|nr:hypothetical protein [Candidatus Pacearchaeota archaeon]
MKKTVEINDFFQKNNRGISAIIVTLLMIVLSLVAVGVVWVVISNVLSSGTEQVSSGVGQLLVNLKLENVKIQANGDVQATVKRSSGQGELSAINFIVSDGTNSQVIKKDASGLKELGTQTFTITPADLTTVGFVKDVSIAPLTKDSSGKETIGNAVDNKKIATDQILGGLGLVYRQGFEQDTKPFTGAGISTIEIDSSTSYSGGKSLKHISTDTSSPYDTYLTPHTGASSVIDNFNGGVYTFSAMVKSSSANGKLGVFIFCLDGGYSYATYGNKNRAYDLTTNWKEYSISHQCPSGTSYISIRADNDVASPGANWYDELMVFNKNVTNSLPQIYELIKE